MSRLKTYTEFINEGLIDAIKNPFKWRTIKKAAVKFQKAKVAHALNDVDYAKKLASSDSKQESDILKKANAVKNAALKDIQSNISTAMDDAATTDGLKAVVRLAKTKASLTANGIIIKAATGEQAKQLKIRQKKLQGQVADAGAALKDYESSDSDDEGSEMDKLQKKKEDDSKAEEAKKLEDERKLKEKEAKDAKIADFNSKIDELKGKDNGGDKAKDQQTQVSIIRLKIQIAKLSEDDTKVSELETELSDAAGVLDDDKLNAQDPPVDKTSKESMLDRAQTQLATAKESGDEDKIKKAQDLIDKISQKESWELQDTDLGKLFESELDKLEKFINAYIPLVESVSTKFKRLRLTL